MGPIAPNLPLGAQHSRVMLNDYDTEDPDDYRCPMSPCPIGLPQRQVLCLAYREREPGRLQLRVEMSLDEGICDAIAEECDDRVFVRVMMCYDPNEPREDDTLMNCPVHVYLEQPLGDRKVIDAATGDELPLHVPTWG